MFAVARTNTLEELTACLSEPHSPARAAAPRPAAGSATEEADDWRPAGSGMMELVNCHLPGSERPLMLAREQYRRLHPYQRGGVAWMARLAEAGHGGILADEMGLGKTVQICTLLSALRRGSATHALVLLPVSLLDQWKREVKTWCPEWPVFTYYGSAIQRAKALNSVMRPAGGILLTSYSLFSHSHAILSQVTLAETAEVVDVLSDDECQPQASKRRRKGQNELTLQGKVVAGKNCRRAPSPAHGNQRAWDIVVCDEAHNLKNISTLLGKSIRHLRARCRLLLTGTPVQNALKDLWALMDFAQPGLLGNYATFTKHFSDPINAGSVRNASAYAVGLKKHLSEQLWQLISPHLLRRTKLHVGLLADDVPPVDKPTGAANVDSLPPAQAGQMDQEADAPMEIASATPLAAAADAVNLSALPRKLETIVWLLPTPEQACVYKAILERSEVIRQASVKSRLGLDVFRAIGLLKRLCNHPILTIPAASSSASHWTDLLAKMGSTTRAEDAEGEAEADVLDEELPEGEPTARVAAAAADRGCSGPEAEQILLGLPQSAQGLLAQSAKLRCLRALLPALVARGHRMLVFSQGARMLDLVEACVLRPLGMAHSRIDGRTPAAMRAERVKEFQEQLRDVPCMLLTTGVGGVGLNLTTADRVILLDPAWNPATDAQAVDRVFRLGQTREVRVYRLIMSGLMEDKVFRLQVFKMGLMSGALDTKDQRHYFTSREIKGLFDWTDPEEGETRRLLNAAHGQDGEEAALAAAKDDGAFESWYQAGPAVGLSNFSMLFNHASVGGVVPEPGDEQSAKVAEMKAKLVSAEEKLRETTEAKQSTEQQSEATQEAFEDASQRVAAAIASRAQAEQRLRERTAELKVIKRLEGRAKEQLDRVAAKRAQAAEALQQQERRCQEAHRLAASARGVRQAARSALAESERSLSAAVASSDAALALSGTGRGHVRAMAARKAFQALCEAMDAVEAANVELESSADYLARLDGMLVDAQHDPVGAGSASGSGSAVAGKPDGASSETSDARAARHEAERAVAEGELGKARQRVQEIEGREAQAMAAFVQAVTGLADVASGPQKSALGAAVQQLQAAWEASRGLREPWRRTLETHREPARQVAAAEAAKAAAARLCERADRDCQVAEEEGRARAARRQACEAEADAARTARQEAEAEEARWRRRRDELRVALGATHLAVLKSAAAVEGAATQQEALRAWCSRADNLQLRVESATTSALEVLRAEAYNAQQVEDAYQASRRQKWVSTRKAFNGRG